MIRLLVVLIISILTAITYRMGGSGNYPRFLRPLGVGIGVILSELLLCYPVSLWMFLAMATSAGASAGLSTTYFKKKGSDAKWYNWLACGVAFSLAVIPLHLILGHWLGFAIRTIVLILGITLWSEFQGNAVKEELGRGLLIPITLPLSLI